MSRDGAMMKVIKRIQIPSPLNIGKLQSQDWMTVHITRRALVVEGFTYSLNSKLCTRLEMIDLDKKQHSSSVRISLLDTEAIE